LAGFRNVEVEGATGNIDTNFYGKAQAALKELESGQDFVYLHIEAPDECGHRHEIENKVKSIELIDDRIVGPIIEGLEKYDDYRILILPDHPTPLSLRTHTAEPVPFLLYQKTNPKKSGVTGYDELQAAKTGIILMTVTNLWTTLYWIDKSDNFSMVSPIARKVNFRAVFLCQNGIFNKQVRSSKRFISPIIPSLL